MELTLTWLQLLLAGKRSELGKLNCSLEFVLEIGLQVAL